VLEKLEIMGIYVILNGLFRAMIKASYVMIRIKQLLFYSLLIPAITLAHECAADPYKNEVKEAASRWGVDSHDLRALIQVVSGFKPGSSTSVVGLGRFSSIATKEVARLAKLAKNKERLNSAPSLRASLQNFSLAKAKDSRLAIEATALYYKHLIDTYGNKSAALTHYRAGGVKAIYVKRHGLDEAHSRSLIETATMSFVDRVLKTTRSLTERDPIGEPPVRPGPERAPSAAPASPSARSGAPNLPTASDEVKRHWTTSAPRRSGRVRIVQQNPKLYDALVVRAARRWNIDANLLRGLIQAESMFDPRARSPTGAAGLGQFTGVAIAEVKRLIKKPKYAVGYASDPALKKSLQSFNKTMAHTPLYAIEATALYLKYVLDRYKSEEAALTAYNAGHKMARLVQVYGSHAKARRAGVLTFSQAKSYAPKVLRYKEAFKEGPWPGINSPGLSGALGNTPW
jgi:soluble lytic murein transglycosylase-like protein